MIIETKQHHFTTSNERKYAYTFYPYKQQRNFGGHFDFQNGHHCHGYSVLFGGKILNLPSISVENFVLICQEMLILQQKT